MQSHTLPSLSYTTYSMFQFRGSELVELQSSKPASIDDIVNVHAKAYVSGLEKVAYSIPLNSFHIIVYDNLKNTF